MILTIVLYCSFIKTYVSAYIRRRYREKEIKSIKEVRQRLTTTKFLGKRKKKENKEYQAYSDRPTLNC